MLVYANHLSAHGAESGEAIFRAVGRWTKEQLGFGLHPDQLKRNGRFQQRPFEQGNSRLRIHTASAGEDLLYSWVLSKGDSAVHGRWWITELGARTDESTAELSCVLRTDDRSTLIGTDNLVSASQPRVMRYAAQNIRSSTDCEFDPSVPGIELKVVGQSRTTYRAFLTAVDRADRDFPVVLISPTSDGEYLLDPEILQDRLVGLAQVVKTDPSYNSYEMESELSKFYSAWDGSVNVLHPPNRAGAVRNSLFLSNEIEAWGGKEERNASVLAQVTHRTNVFLRRRRIRAELVANLSAREEVTAAFEHAEDLSAAELKERANRIMELQTENQEYIDEFDNEIHGLRGDVSHLSQELTDTKGELNRERSKNRELKNRLEGSGRPPTNTADVNALVELVCRGTQPRPIECLTILESLFGDRCTVLESAERSADESTRFGQGARLLALLKTLVTDYRDTYMERGDVEARKCFSTGEFAATESETVVQNQTLKSARTFEYKSQSIEMFSHLKIGVADDKVKTIRVHFHWDAKDRMIIIGYCGPHLPVSAH